MSYYTPPPKYATELVSRKGYSGTGGVSDFGSAVKNFLTGTIDVAGHALDVATGRQTQPPMVVQQESGMPGWVLPVGIAAAGIGLVVLLKRRK